MKHPYQSPNPNSGVTFYEFTPDGIILDFAHGTYRYLYNAVAPGPAHVAAMKRLAAAGQGLSTYVSRNVGPHYAVRLPL